ncbi:MAG: putative peptidoglycan lipid flippase [Solirubrobacterales bacterium]|jgi:putative peptidoglycan lipid II flippase|nr:putative peptidoglycan lipid flippase [Solirubrobacterales bacterium]
MSESEGREPDLGDLADVAAAEVVPQEEVTAPRPRAGRLAVSTAFFSFATGLSRIAGLVREIFAASYFGVSGAMSAFTIAFQVPNLVRSLFADAAIQAAFVPVFTEKLERGNRREAFALASHLIFVVTLVLGALTALFILIAPVLMPVFVPASDQAVADLTVTLSRILFPILVLLGVTGMVVGILNSYDRFAAFAISPFFWNVAIIIVLVGLAPAFPKGDQIYAYAVGVLIGTVIQLAIPLWDLRRTPYGLRRALKAPFTGRIREAFRDLDVRRVLLLMLPVTVSLGLINFNLLINSTAGFLVSEEAPAAIDKAFRIYMLPQGVFSVAVATVLFPTLARFAARGDLDRLRSTMASGMRLIVLLLVPATAAILVLSEPMVRLVYQRGDFDPEATQLVSTALFWFAFSLPFNGLFLLLTRTFFSLQRPWVPTAIAAGNLAITAVAAFALYGPFGIGGIVAGTAIATAAAVAAQAIVLRRALGRLELGRLAWTTTRVLAASALLAAVSYEVWNLLDEQLGQGLGGQIVSLGAGLLAGAVVYGIAITLLRIPEADRIWALVGRGRGAQAAVEQAPEEFDEADGGEAGDELILGLVILPGSPRAGEVFAVDQEQILIGRSPDADVSLDDRSVSREHAQLVQYGDGTWIEDLDSRNGTFVNRRRVEAQLLEDGDEIQIGVYSFSYLERA